MMKRALFLICGLCWFMFGLGFGIFLLQYLAQGAGLQDFGPAWPVFGQLITSGSIMMGMLHGMGLFLASAFCFVVGLGLFSYALASHRDDQA